MLRTLWTSKSAMNANQNKLDVISNNIANVNTDGYKKVETSFKDLYTESLNKLGTPLNDTTSVSGTGVRNSIITRNFTQGSLTETSITTDLGLDGEGLFKIIAPDGSELYTRSGSFYLDQNGNLDRKSVV